MKLEHLLLGTLLMRPRTGYDLKRFMDLHGVFMRERTQMSQVYRSLSAMNERGWLRFTVSGRPGAHDAKIYHVTAAGKAEFLRWLHSPLKNVVGIVNYELRARLWFSGFLTLEQILALVDAEIFERQRQVAKYRYRDRSIDVDDHAGFDLEVARIIEEQTHLAGARAMDTHIEDMIRIRETVLERLRERDAAEPAAS